MVFAALALGGLMLLAGAVRTSPSLSAAGLALLLFPLLAAALRHA